MNNKITAKINVKDNLINVMRVDNIDYISLTDLARYKKKSFYWYKKVIESNGDEL